jgi:acyl-CoA synthetase (AMP-forming)/AMP-acid ligase II
LKHSSSTSAAHPDVLERIGDYLDIHARATPRAPALVFEGTRTSYATLRRRVDECAMALLAAGIRKGARVAMLCTPRPEYWIVFLAATRIGAIWIGLNPKYRLRELSHITADAEPGLMFAMAEFEGRHFAGDVTELRRRSSSLTAVVGLGDLGGDCTGFEAFLASHRECPVSAYEDARAAVGKFDPALIVYTSGTTGAPKGAVLSHHSICAGAVMQTTHLRVDRPAMVVNFPINHVACVADTCATTYVKGGKIVFQERFDARATLAAIEAEHCTIMGGVPTMLQMMLAHPDFRSTDFSSVELIAWGGAAMPRDAIAGLGKICARLMPLYGMTETAANVTYGDENAGVDELVDSIGKPDAGVGCRIVDGSGASCPPGIPGELQFKAAFLMLGYWRNRAATKAAFTGDGWLRTGDIGAWRADGNIRLVGRRSEMFKSGGYNIYPREIEIALESIPGVAAAAVIGVPDELYQEVGYAFVLPDGTRKLTEQGLRDACNERLANYKVPKAFAIRNELPLLPTGKIDRESLAASAGQGPSGSRSMTRP